MQDYNGYSRPACTIDGQTLPELSSYTVSVSITSAPLSGVTEALRIAVTVSRGSDTLRLVGWRTHYGG